MGGEHHWNVEQTSDQAVVKRLHQLIKGSLLGSMSAGRLVWDL